MPLCLCALYKASFWGLGVGTIWFLGLVLGLVGNFFHEGGGGFIVGQAKVYLKLVL